MIKKIISLLLACGMLCACGVKENETLNTVTSSPAPSVTPANDSENNANYRPPKASTTLNSVEEFQQFIAFLNSDLESDGDFSRYYGNVGYKKAYMFYEYTLDEVKRNLAEGCYPTFDSDKMPDEYKAIIFEPEIRYSKNGLRKATGGFLGRYEFYFKIDGIKYCVEYVHKEKMGNRIISTEQPNFEIDGVGVHLKAEYLNDGRKKFFSRYTQISDSYYMKFTIWADSYTFEISDINLDGIHFFK